MSTTYLCRECGRPGRIEDDETYCEACGPGVEPVQYDPEKHGDDYLAMMEPGDTLYVFTEVLKEG